MIRNYNKTKKATLCYDRKCITVYGETASFVNKVVGVAVIALALTLLYKALK